MKFFSTFVKIILLSAFLLPVALTGIAWLTALPSLNQLDEYVTSGELEITQTKERWILEVYTTRDLAVYGFREAYLEGQDRKNWHDVKTKLASAFVLAFRNILFTKEEWAAIYCSATSCLDQWSKQAYNRPFHELNEAEAKCAMQLSITYSGFRQCDSALSGNFKE